MSAHTITQWLDERGLLLCAFKWGELPDTEVMLIKKAIHNTTNIELTKDTQLLLLANAGPLFWRCLQRTTFKNHTDPVDAFSLKLASELQATFLNDRSFTQLYPTPEGNSHIPLMRLGGLAGWNLPSRLGLGLHPEFGPWSAYRVAWLTNSDTLPNEFYQQEKPSESTGTHGLHTSAELCVSCSAPCVSACPAAAVAYGETFQTERCYEHSRPEDSDCHTHCFARVACPIGVTHQYDKQQLAHHMGMRWRK